LEAAVKILKPGGRLAVISFHSVEDRVVKEFGRRLSRDYESPGEVDVPELRRPRPPLLRWVWRKALRPGEAELRENPRSRSAQCRVLEKLNLTKKRGNKTMARNRKNDSALRVAPVLSAVTLCALFAGLGVGYVWYKNQIDILGHQIKDREQRLAGVAAPEQDAARPIGHPVLPCALDACQKLNLGSGAARALASHPAGRCAGLRAGARPRLRRAAARPVKVALAARKN
jgi:hypothetical protein